MNLPDIALEEAALKALADAIEDRLKAVRAVMQEQLDTTGIGRLDVKLPDGAKVATISATDPKPAAVVTDPEKLIAWVCERSPHNVVSRVVTEIAPAYLKALLAELTAAGVPVWCDRETGELHDVPGVEIRATRARSHSVRPVDGGREAIVQAWRTGRLAHLSGLPQLTAGTGGER